VSAEKVESYLLSLEEPKQATLRHLRDSILRTIPDAEECISYGMPAFKIGDKVIAGFAAFKDHLSYFPHSGSVLPEMSDALGTKMATKATLRFGVDEPLPDEIVGQLIAIRLRQAFPSATS
jgi:uncharacterized protein YdhG (YjbR/CyaY superfamily)